jgi:2',3'-cyclic-nucleotide 2'-phosphodiesterase
MEIRRLRILFIGDVVGQSGLDAVSEHLPRAISEWDIELTIIN